MYPKKHVLNNEVSNLIKETIAEVSLTYKMVPTDMHRRNLTKQAILDWKALFIAVLCGTDKSFSRNQLDRLTPQAVKTINMLQFTNSAPKVSNHTYMHDAHNYNKEPLAPMGCAVQARDKPKKRKYGTRTPWTTGMSKQEPNTIGCTSILKRDQS